MEEKIQEDIIEDVQAVEVPAATTEQESEPETVDVSEKVDSEEITDLPVESKATETNVQPEDEVSLEPFVEEELPAETPLENTSDISAVVVTDEPEVESDVFTEVSPEVEATEAYEPIVLVPAEPNPPAVEETVEETTEEIAVEETTVEVVEEVKVTEVNTNVVENVVTSEVKVDEVASNVKDDVQEQKKTEQKKDDKYNFDKYTVPSLKSLKSNSYYVQIAVLSEKANIKAILDKYSKKYPITLVPMASGKTTQVLVGPLSVDEYGTVLNRFKSYGYKDAFLRKIR